ncbi:DUF1330 domain-containing protein [Nocardia sp. NPDC049526]|uniref:DUF1330 domain-containing protein n=1 Tax=Nocardia sp. NPDC049526 TaxID=3364316 RepID=UPI003798548E
MEPIAVEREAGQQDGRVFPDEPSFREWADSPEYQEISKDRHAGADTVTLLINGMDRRS